MRGGSIGTNNGKETLLLLLVLIVLLLIVLVALISYNCCYCRDTIVYLIYTNTSTLTQNVQSATQNVTLIRDITLVKNWRVISLLIIIPSILVLMILIIMGYFADKNLNKSEMRRAIAGTIIVGIHALLAVSIIFNISRDIIIGAYIAAVNSIMGFYFGSRTAQTQQQDSQNKNKPSRKVRIG